MRSRWSVWEDVLSRWLAGPGDIRPQLRQRGRPNGRYRTRAKNSPIPAPSGRSSLNDLARGPGYVVGAWRKTMLKDRVLIFTFALVVAAVALGEMPGEWQGPQIGRIQELEREYGLSFSILPPIVIPPPIKPPPQVARALISDDDVLVVRFIPIEDGKYLLASMIVGHAPSPGDPYPHPHPHPCTPWPTCATAYVKGLWGAIQNSY